MGAKQNVDVTGTVNDIVFGVEKADSLIRTC